MRNARWIIALGMVTVIACSPRESGVAPPAPSASLLAESSDARAERMALIAAVPGLYKLDGHSQIVYHEGVEVARQVMGESGTAESGGGGDWVFATPMRLFNPASGHMEFYGQIEIDHGQGHGYSGAIPLAGGKIYKLSGFGVASPDGRTIAAGQNEEVSMDGGSNLTVYDWAGGAQAKTFAVQCQPEVWPDNDSFTAVCLEGADGVLIAVEAEISRAEGRWTLQETGVVRGDTENGPGQRPRGPQNVYEASPVPET